ncbi:uncharacterized protein CLUP02_14024, partial [Colletotrichum lupini]
KKKQLYCTCAPWANAGRWNGLRSKFCKKKFLFVSTIGLSLCSFESPWHLALRFLYYEPCGCLARHAGSYSLSFFLRKGTAYISRSAGWPAYSVCMFRTGLRSSQLSTERKCKVRGRFVERHLGTRNHHVLDGKTGRIAAGERERSYGFLVDDQENFGRSRHWSLLPGGRCCLSGALDQSKKRPSQRPTRVGNGGPTETVAQRKEQRRSRGISGEAREGGGKGKINGLL